MTYQAPLPNTGAILPVLGSGQAWEGSVYNGNFTGVDAAIGADRARLTTIEGKLVGNGLVPAGTTAARDGLYGVPSNAAARVALANTAPRWFNTDAGKNYTQQYFAQDGDAGAGVNTRTTAGWYAAIDSGRVPLTGFTTAVTGGTLTRDGGNVLLSGAVTSFSLNGCFTNDFQVYDIEADLLGSAGAQTFWRARNAGSDTGWNWNRNRVEAAASMTVTQEVTQSAANFGRVDTLGGLIDLSIINPMDATRRTMSKGSGWDGSSIIQQNGSVALTAGAHDGLTIFVPAGSFTGRVRLFGRNPF
jgi:hypothetical protein